MNTTVYKEAGTKPSKFFLKSSLRYDIQ